MTGTLGRFLELSLPTTDIQASLAFYRALGFTELPTGDVRDYHYAVVSDGRIAIGLHGGGPRETALSFVLADVATRVQALVAGGIEPDFSRLGTEHFNEAGLRDPAGHLLWLLEAPTFSPSLASAPPTAAGQAVAIALPGGGEAQRRFWLEQGFVDDDAPVGLLRLLAPGLVLEFDPRSRGPELRLRGADPDALGAAVERAGLTARRAGERLLLHSPEGLLLVIGDAGPTAP